MRREMELQCIESKVLKLILNCIAKILSMSGAGYPKSVLKILLEADINNEANIVKYNWRSIVKKAFFLH